MVYRRRAVIRRRRPYRSNRPRTVVAVRRPYRTKRVVRREYRRMRHVRPMPELKHLDANAVNSVAIPGTPVNGVLYSLTNMAQGLTRNTRLGNRIMGKSLHIKFDLHWNSEGQEIQKVGVGVFLKRATNGDDIQTNEIFDDHATSFSRLNVDNIRNYRPLRLRQFNLSAQRPVIHVNWYIKFHLELKWDGTTSAVGDTTHNLIQCLSWSDQVANHPTMLNYYSRFRYTDM